MLASIIFLKLFGLLRLIIFGRYRVTKLLNKRIMSSNSNYCFHEAED